LLWEQDVGGSNPLTPTTITLDRALEAINRALEILRFSPFSCRKAGAGSPFVREVIIPFGSAGYVALFEIEAKRTVTLLAVRHQREDDYR
jgi:hypothetical protein